MLSPIPFMVRRARLIRGETQGQFAIHMGVDQATVSRWERSKSEPTPVHLDEIRRIIITAEPCYSRAYIEAAPTIKYMCRRDNFLKPLVISRGLAEAAGFDSDDVIRNPESYIKEGEGLHRLNTAVQAEAKWELGEIAFFEATFFAPKLGEWVRTIGAPLAETNAALIEAAPIGNPKEEFWIKLTPFEELVEDA
jgi:transcriptional regulator with XRE-family HTH domain